MLPAVQTELSTQKRAYCAVACDVCKRRRRKCTGTIPCEYCHSVDRPEKCTYTTPEKRGPKKKLKDDQSVATFNVLLSQSAASSFLFSPSPFLSSFSPPVVSRPSAPPPASPPVLAVSPSSTFISASPSSNPIPHPPPAYYVPNSPIVITHIPPASSTPYVPLPATLPSSSSSSTPYVHLPATLPSSPLTFSSSPPPSSIPQLTPNSAIEGSIITKGGKEQDEVIEESDGNDGNDSNDDHSPFQVALYQGAVQECAHVWGLPELSVSCLLDDSSSHAADFESSRAALRAQVYSMAASVARHRDELVKAERLMREVSKNLKEIFEVQTMEAAVAFFCASTYYPTYGGKCKMYCSHAWQLAEKAIIKSEKDSRMRAYIYFMLKLCDNSLSLHDRCVAMTGDSNYLRTTVGGFEGASVQFIRMLTHIAKRFDFTNAPCALNSLASVQFSNEEKEEFLLDLRILESFVSGMPELVYINPYFTSWKILVLWKSGDIAAATKDAEKVGHTLEAHPEQWLLFYADILPVLLIVEFFRETNNVSWHSKIGSIAMKLVNRTLQNSHFHFYQELLELVFPQSSSIELTCFENNPIQQDSVFDSMVALLFEDIAQ